MLVDLSNIVLISGEMLSLLHFFFFFLAFKVQNLKKIVKKNHSILLFFPTKREQNIFFEIVRF